MPEIGERSGNAIWNGASWDRDPNAPANPASASSGSPYGSQQQSPSVPDSYYQNVTYPDLQGGPDQTMSSGGRFGMFPDMARTQALQGVLGSSGITSDIVNENDGRGFTSPRHDLLVNGNMIDPEFVDNTRKAATNADGSFNQAWFDKAMASTPGSGGGIGGLGMAGNDSNQYSPSSPGQKLTQDAGHAVSSYTPIPTKGQYNGMTPGYNPAKPMGPYGPGGGLASATPASGSGGYTAPSGGGSSIGSPVSSGYGSGFGGGSSSGASGLPSSSMNSSYSPTSMSASTGSSIPGQTSVGRASYRSPLSSVRRPTGGMSGGAYR